MSDLRTDLLKVAQEDPRFARELVAAMPALMRELEKGRKTPKDKPKDKPKKDKPKRSERPRSDIGDMQRKIDEAMKSKPKKDKPKKDDAQTKMLREIQKGEDDRRSKKKEEAKAKEDKAKEKFKEYKEDHPKSKMSLMEWIKSKFKKTAFNQAIRKLAHENPEFRQALSREFTAALWTPRSRRDWQIYDNPGAGQAARELTSALVKTRKLLMAALKTKEYKSLDPDWNPKDMSKVAKLIGKVYDKAMYPTMRKHNAFGATDTEPRNVAAQGLIDAAKAYYGITGWTELGDYI